MAENEQPRSEPDQEPGKTVAGENEGEGSRSGDAQYRAGVEEHLKQADVEQEAEQARRLKCTADLAHYRAIVESAGAAIVSADLEGRITSWNTGAERLYGWSWPEVVGRGLSLLVPPGADEAPTWGRIRRGSSIEVWPTLVPTRPTATPPRKPSPTASRVRQRVQVSTPRRANFPGWRVKRTAAKPLMSR